MSNVYWTVSVGLLWKRMMDSVIAAKAGKPPSRWKDEASGGSAYALQSAVRVLATHYGFRITPCITPSPFYDIALDVWIQRQWRYFLAGRLRCPDMALMLEYLEWCESRGVKCGKSHAVGRRRQPVSVHGRHR
jgi:hypothetical protein